MAKTTIPVELSSTPGITDNSNATAITIDSSENVLVGKTSTGITTVGAELKPTGELVATVSGDACAFLNRKTSDGDIINLRKDNTIVGSIGSEGGDALFIQGGSTNGSGFVFHPSNSFIAPARNGLKIDNTIDLGKSNSRYKDFYVGGNIYLGGTGSANALDDYEEGTWTPTLGGATLTTATGKYTKIGNQVTVYYHVVTSGGLPTSSADVQVGGLPFTIDSNGAGAIYARYYTLDDSSLTTILVDGDTYIRLVNVNEESFDYTHYGELEASHNNSLDIRGTASYIV